jgi:hypothetical protein
MIAILLIIGCIVSISMLAGFGWFVWYSEEAKREALEASIEENERISLESSRKLKTYANKINNARDELTEAQDSLVEAEDSGNMLKVLQAKKDIEDSEKLIELNKKLQEEAKGNEDKANELVRINIELIKKKEAADLLQREIELSKKKREREILLKKVEESRNSYERDRFSRDLVSATTQQKLQEQKVISAKQDIKSTQDTYSSILNTFKTKKETGGNGRAIFLDKHDIKCSDKKILNGFVLKTSGKDIYYDYNCISGGELDLNKFGIEKKTVSEPLNNAKYLDRHDVNCGTDSVMSRAKLSNKNGKWYYDYTCSENKFPLTCRKLSTSLNNNGNGNNAYLDRHQIKCNSDEGLSQFKLVNVGDKYRYDYTCCSSTGGSGGSGGTRSKEWNREDFVQYTKDGTDLPGQPIMGSLSECKTKCEDSGECIGFSRSKSASARDNCWLKKQFPSKTYNNKSYETYTLSYELPSQSRTNDQR